MMMRCACLTLFALAACSPAKPDREERAAAPAAAAEPAPKVADPRAPAAPMQVSRFTTNGLDKCKLVEKNEEEGGYFRHLCPGIDGYRYEHVEGDLRQNLVIIGPDGKRGELDLNRIGGGGFSTLGATFDWRGPSGKPPRAVTVRYNVNEDPSPKVAPRSYLVVIRLDSPACILAAVPPGAGQSAAARDIADRDPLPACLAD